MDLKDVHEIADAFARLGDAIGKQVEKILDDPSPEGIRAAHRRGDLNMNAVRYAGGWVERVARVAEGDLADEAAEVLGVIKAEIMEYEQNPEAYGVR